MTPQFEYRYELGDEYSNGVVAGFTVIAASRYEAEEKAKAFLRSLPIVLRLEEYTTPGIEDFTIGFCAEGICDADVVSVTPLRRERRK